jgi:hypothetical protein
MDDQPIFLFQFEYFSTLLKVNWKIWISFFFTYEFLFRINPANSKSIKALIQVPIHHRLIHLWLENVHFDPILPNIKHRKHFNCIPHRKLIRFCLSQITNTLRFSLRTF